MKNNFLVILLCAAIISCTTPLEVVDEPGTIIEYDYEEVDAGAWDAPIDFCLRHRDMAERAPAYNVDMCVTACELNPEEPWCHD